MASHLLAQPTYSRDQITAYFEHIKLRQEQCKYDVTGLGPQETLDYLSLLQKHNLAAVPFENLTLHYSPHRAVVIHPEALFKKIVGDNNGRGGYCMENNYLFNTVLRTLGFDLFSAGARVYDNDQWTGWSHMVNIVKIGGDKYHVDVGFGGNGPVEPMKLDRSGELIQAHIAPGSARLQWGNIPGNTDPDQRLWIYQHRIDADSDFQTAYCFTELEFLPQDYNIMNYFVSTSHKTFFTRSIVVEKKIMDDNGELIGQLIMGNADLKWRVRGKKEREMQFQSEDDRVRALEEHFGIVLGPVERASVRGLASELKVTK